MYRLQVAPLTKLSSQFGGTLTYQYTEPLPVGSAVTVPIHTRNITGIVVICQPLTNDDVDQKSFETKLIHAVLSQTPLLTSSQLALAQWMAAYYAYPLGLILKLFLPRLSKVIKRYPKILDQDHNPLSPVAQPTTPFKSPRIFLGDQQSRIGYYHHLHAQYPTSQILIICPDKQALIYLKGVLNELEPIVISSEASTKEYRALWTRIKQGTPGLIISTRVGLFLPYTNLAWICLEDDTSDNHSSQEMKPKYQTQEVAKQLSHLYRIPLTRLSLLPSIQSLWELEQFHISLISECLPSIANPPTVVSMSDQYRLGLKGILAEETLNFIQNALKTRTPVIIYVNRRGESTYISCDDCGYHLRDPYTGSLLVEHRVDTLSQKPKEYGDSHILVSHKSNKWFKMVHQCPKCHSVNLIRGGIGIERVAHTLLNIFPDSTIDILSADSSPDLETQLHKLSALERGETQILIATSMIYKFFPRLSQTKFVVAIPSVDSLVGLPDYSTLERALQTLYLITSTAQKFIMQSFQDWDPDKDKQAPFANRFLTESPLTLLQEELELRKTYHYPPSYQIIALETVHASRGKALTQAKTTKGTLRTLNIPVLGPLESYRPRGKGQYVFTLILQATEKQAQSFKSNIVPVLSHNQTMELNPRQLIS